MSYIRELRAKSLDEFCKDFIRNGGNREKKKPRKIRDDISKRLKGNFRKLFGKKCYEIFFISGAFSVIISERTLSGRSLGDFGVKFVRNSGKNPERILGMRS